MAEDEFSGLLKKFVTDKPVELSQPTAVMDAGQIVVSWEWYSNEV